MTNIGAGRPGSALSRHDLHAILFGAAVAMFLAALDQTIVAPALPVIARDLGEFNAISWLVTAYLLSSTAVTPIFGKLSDLYGRRRLLLAGLAIFDFAHYHGTREALFDVQAGSEAAKRHDADMAITLYSKAIDAGTLDSDTQADVIKARGMARLQKQDWEGAAADFTQAVKRRVDDPVAHFGLGLAYSGQGKDEAALQELDRTINLNRNTDDKELLSNGGQYMCQGGVKLLKDTWYCLEFYFDGPGQETRILVDGTEVPALHTTDWGTYDYKIFKLGYEKYGGQNKTLWYDDLALATEQRPRVAGHAIEGLAEDFFGAGGVSALQKHAA